MKSPADNILYRCHTCDFIVRFCRATLSCACRILRRCRINKKWPISLASDCLCDKVAVCDMHSCMLQLCRAMKLRDKFAQQNRKCDIGLKIAVCCRRQVVGRLGSVVRYTLPVFAGHVDGPYCPKRVSFWTSVFTDDAFDARKRGSSCPRVVWTGLVNTGSVHRPLGRGSQCTSGRAVKRSLLNGD